MIRKSILVALPLALAACGSDQPAGEPSPEANSAADSAPRPAVPFPVAALVLSPDGLAVKGGKPLTFGTPRAAVDEFAAARFGAAARTGRNEECGAGPMEFSSYGPLQLLFQDGKFGGWYLARDSAEARRVVTVDGIAPGTSMAALTAERQVRAIDDSTLDGEFEYLSATGGMITGLYEGDVRSGTITGLSAGLNCFFR